jgi:EAL domain-containing protein (putative c-di-GMP-specific phosphodiesterase class I)
LTEREKVEDITRMQATLSAMKRAGLRIAADDVGAGNAGLRLLSQFRFDIVKIDLSLVQDGAEHDTSRAVLRSLRDLAGRWGASVIAEGLETAGQLRTIRELGMTAGQGYLLARPMPRAILTEIDMEPLAMGGSILDRRLPQPRQAPDGIRTQGAY